MAGGVPQPRDRLRARDDRHPLRAGAPPGAGAVDRSRVIGFTAPWALFGLAAAAVPLLLHLFPPRRFPRPCPSSPDESRPRWSSRPPGIWPRRRGPITAG